MNYDEWKLATPPQFASNSEQEVCRCRDCDRLFVLVDLHPVENNWRGLKTAQYLCDNCIKK